jgi:hypothetical protein
MIYGLSEHGPKDEPVPDCDCRRCAVARADRQSMHARMWMAAMASLAEISMALEIPDDDAASANGNSEILAAISRLKDMAGVGRDPCPCMSRYCYVGDHD